MQTLKITTNGTLTRLVATLILVFGLMTSLAMAQDKDGTGFSPVGHYTGAEASPGSLEPTTGIRYGNTLVMNSFGEWETFCLTVSVDYATAQFVPNNFIVTGGTWSLVILRDGGYYGTVFGTVSRGNVLVLTNSNGDPSNGDMIQLTEVTLQATRGLGAFSGKKVEHLIGVGNMKTDLRSNKAEGSVEFSFSR